MKILDQAWMYTVTCTVIFISGMMFSDFLIRDKIKSQTANETNLTWQKLLVSKDLAEYNSKTGEWQFRPLNDIAMTYTIVGGNTLDFSSIKK